MSRSSYSTDPKNVMHAPRLRYVLYSIVALLIVAIIGMLILSCIRKPDDEPAVCGDPAEPLLSVGDFNADGIVDGLDLAEIREVDSYGALYDRNADGVIDDRDVEIVSRELGSSSTAPDREIAAAYQRFSRFQTIDDSEQLRPEFRPFTTPLAGHGEHWANAASEDAITGVTRSSFERAEGLNVAADGSGVWAMFWAEAATPVFEGGATDWPTAGGEWENQRVVAFSDAPPKLTSDPRAQWHTHTGLCLFRNLEGERESHQHTSYRECQGYESLSEGANAWVNMWMLHMWLFELNPNGIWGNTHPCLDPGAASEDELNDGRRVPPFFEH